MGVNKHFPKAALYELAAKPIELVDQASDSIFQLNKHCSGGHGNRESNATLRLYSKSFVGIADLRPFCMDHIIPFSPSLLQQGAQVLPVVHEPLISRCRHQRPDYGCGLEKR